MTASAQLIVTPNNNANTLAGSLIGSGITIVPGSATYTGAAAASGTFTGGTGAGIGINSGILLTSGAAIGATGPNTSGGNGVNNGAPGDAQLTALAGQTTFNAAVLTFDFTTSGGDLFFSFVFGSEEYNEFVGSFNDVFAFFVDGMNIALVPGTMTPVAINTINLGSNPSLYNNNDAAAGSPFNVQYDGFTTVLTAQALGLGAGTHTIKIAIADAGDGILDSGVFIQGGSFTDAPVNGVPETGSTLIFLSVAIGGMVAARRKMALAR